MISIIVPIFQGEKYINNMIEQVEHCSKYVSEEVELILCSDDPEIVLEGNYFSSNIYIKSLNTKNNTGIHAARVRGFAHSKGEYVVFVDQDDMIFPTYLQSQLGKIGDADAVVCQIVQDGKLLYSEDNRINNVNDLSFYFSQKNPIVTPGQVLIRREAIPNIWLKNIISSNGSDDYALWVCMLKNKSVFSLNMELQFEHIMHLDNCSNNAMKMNESEMGALRFWEDNSLISNKEKTCFKRAIETRSRNRLNKETVNQLIFETFEIWDIKKNNGWFLTQGIRNCSSGTRIGIYGAGKVGRRIQKELEEKKVNVLCFIDRDAEKVMSKVKTYSLDDEWPDLDILIISLVLNEKEVIEDLINKKTKAEIVTIRDILLECSKREMSNN